MSKKIMSSAGRVVQETVSREEMEWCNLWRRRIWRKDLPHALLTFITGLFCIFCCGIQVKAGETMANTPPLPAGMEAKWGLTLNTDDPNCFAGLSSANGRLLNFIAGRTVMAEALGLKMELLDKDNYYEVRYADGKLYGNAFTSRRSEPKNSTNEGKDGQSLKLSLDRKLYAPNLGGTNPSLKVGADSESQSYPLGIVGDYLTASFSHIGEKELALRAVEKTSVPQVALEAAPLGSALKDVKAAVFSDHFNIGLGNFQCLPAVFDKIQGTEIVLYKSSLKQIDGRDNITGINPLPNTLAYGKRIRFGIHVKGDKVLADETSYFNVGIINNLKEKLGLQIRVPANELSRLFQDDWYIVDLELSSDTPVYPGKPKLSAELLSSFPTMQFDLDFKFKGSTDNLSIWLSPVIVYNQFENSPKALTIGRSLPAANERDIPIYREMYLDFNNPVELFQLKNRISLVDGDNKNVKISFSYRRDQPPGRVYIVPGELLKYGTTYKIRIAADSSIRDIYGQGYQGVAEIPFTTIAHKGYPSGVLWTKAQVEHVKTLQQSNPCVSAVLEEYRSNADTFVNAWNPRFNEYFRPSGSGWQVGKIPGYSPDTKDRGKLFSPNLYQFVSDSDGTPYSGPLTEANKAHYINSWHYNFRSLLPTYAIAWQMTRDIRYAKALHDFIIQYTNCLVSGDKWFTSAYNYKPGDAYTVDPGERLDIGNFIGMDMYAQGIAGSWDMIRDSGLITPQDEVNMARVWKGMIRHVLDFQFHNPAAVHNRILHSANAIMTCFAVMPAEELLDFTAQVSVNRAGVNPRTVNFDYLLNACTLVAKNSMVDSCDFDGVCREGPTYYSFTTSGLIKVGLTFMNDPHNLGWENIINYSDPETERSVRKMVSTMGQWGYPNGVPFSDDNGYFKTTGTSFRPDFAEFLVGVAPADDKYRNILIKQLKEHYKTTGEVRMASIDNLPVMLPDLPEVSCKIEPKPLVWDVEYTGVIAKTGAGPDVSMIRLDTGTFGGKSDFDALALNYYTDGRIWVSSCGAILGGGMSRQKTVSGSASFCRSTAMQNVVVLDGKTYSSGNGDHRYYVRGGEPNHTLVACLGERFKFYKGENYYYRKGNLVPNLESYSRGGVLTSDYLLDQFHVKTTGTPVVKDHQMFYVTPVMEVRRPDGAAIKWTQFPDMDSAEAKPESVYEYHKDVNRADNYSGDLQLLIKSGSRSIRVTYLGLRDVTVFWVKKAPSPELGAPGKDSCWNRIIIRSKADDVAFTLLFEHKASEGEIFKVKGLTAGTGNFFKVDLAGGGNQMDIVRLP